MRTPKKPSAKLQCIPISGVNYSRVRDMAYLLHMPMRQLIDQAVDEYLPQLEQAARELGDQPPHQVYNVLQKLRERAGERSNANATD